MVINHQWSISNSCIALFESKCVIFIVFVVVIFGKWPKIVLRGGQIQKIVNIEGFKGFQGVKNAYIHSTNGCTHGTMDMLSSYMHRPPI